MTAVLNDLLRGELSAIETYAQALQKLDSEPEASVIRRLAGEHSQAATQLGEQIIQLGGKPTTTAGDWAFWARALMSTPRLLRDPIACKALKEGEEHCLKAYEEALTDPELGAESRLLIRFTLIPQQHDHVAALDRLIHSIRCAAGPSLES
jgi:uncharacterized protein (TIGR02284 family)